MSIEVTRALATWARTTTACAMPLGGEIGDIEALARHQPVVLDASLELAPLAQCWHSPMLRGDRSRPSCRCRDWADMCKHVAALRE